MLQELTDPASRRAPEAGHTAPSSSPRFSDNLADIDAACRLVAGYYGGDAGRWAYAAFDHINATLFAGELPTPLIIWALTPHGACLGSTRPGTAPLVTLHPSLLGGREKSNPWGVDPALLGVAYAYDALVHECLHISVASRLGGWAGTGQTSHNNPGWIAEVNRIAPLLGLDITAVPSRTQRVPVPGSPTKRGKQPTKVIRTSGGTIPFRAVATFPHGARLHLGQTAWYTHNHLPFATRWRRGHDGVSMIGCWSRTLNDLVVPKRGRLLYLKPVKL